VIAEKAQLKHIDKQADVVSVPTKPKKKHKREGWSQVLFVALKYLQSYSCHLEARLSCTHHNIALICTTVKPNTSNRQIIVKNL
jgi:hypothetical protein